MITFYLFLIKYFNFTTDKQPSKNVTIGTQCSGKGAECPWDTCNAGFCKNGCVGGSRYADCKDHKKGKNKLCDLRSQNCKDGMTSR